MSNYSEKIPDQEDKNTSWAKIISFVPENSLVLDVGCSSGILGQRLKSILHCQVYGTEIDEGDYRKAQKVLDGAYLFNIETDSLPTAISSKKFDAIIFADVIEHLVDPVAALKIVKKLLKAGGRVIFSIPNMSHISVRLQLLGGDFDYNETGLLDKTHLHFYNFREVKRVFSEAGLQIADLDAAILPYPNSFLKQRLMGLGLSDSGFIEKIAASKEAITFQFVGYAVPQTKANTAPIKLKSSTPEQELTGSIEALQKLYDRQHAELAESKRQEQHLRTQNQTLESYIKNLLASKTWKVGHAIVGPPSKVVAKVRRRKNG